MLHKPRTASDTDSLSGFDPLEFSGIDGTAGVPTASASNASGDVARVPAYDVYDSPVPPVVAPHRFDGATGMCCCSACAANSGSVTIDESEESMPPPAIFADGDFPIGELPSDVVAAGWPEGWDAFATIPSGADSEVAFISGVTSTAKLASTSFWTWQNNNPATYNATNSFAAKWGSSTLSTSGTAGGNVTYWFDAASNWSTTEKNALTSGLALWSAVANITFSLAPSAATANQTFYRGAAGSKTAFQHFDSVTYSTVGSGTDGHAFTSRIVIDTSQPFWHVGTSFEDAGGYGWQTIVHEEGHMIGLGHGGPYNGNKDSSTQQFSKYDMRLWTLMSYIDPNETNAKFYNSYPVTGTNWGVNSQGYMYEPTTPMILDILAAQRIYGEPTSGPLASGGQVFGFNTNISGQVRQYFDFTVNQHPVVTIWDGGANNTLDLSGFTAKATINLNPGTFSSANGQVNNIAIAQDTAIETAISGPGSDVILGSGADNTLRGNAGNDTLDGGPGTDTAVFSGLRSAYTLTALTGNGVRVSGPDGVDTLTNVERLVFNDQTVTWPPGGGGNDDFADSLTDTTAPFGAVTVGGSSTGTLEAASDHDWFRVQLAAGTTYTVDLKGAQTGAGTLTDPYLYLYDSAGVLLASNDDIVQGTNRDSQLTFTATTAGTYYVEARAFGDDLTGTYKLGLSIAAPADDFRDGLNDTTAPLGQVQVGGTTSGNLEVASDRDWLQVQFTAGTSYLINLKGLHAGTGTLEDPYLRVHDSAGTLLAQNDDIELGVNRDSQLTFAAAATGTYYIEAGAFEDRYTGTYSVSVNSTAPADDFRDSLNDTTARLGQVPVGGSAFGNLEVVHDRDWFQVQLTAGTSYEIKLQGLQAGTGTLEDPYLRVYNSAGAFLAANDDIVLGVNRDSQLSFTAATTGTYYVAAGAFDDNYTGTYRVGVVGITGNHAPMITSDGGGDSVTLARDENTAAVTTIVAADQDAGNTLTYSIIGGPDATKFQIDASTGALSFGAAPDFENPADSDHDNGYVVQVRASDGSLFNSQTVRVDVADVAPVITGDNGNNTLAGTPENDTIRGLDGNDRLDGAAGPDRMTGGTGDDWYFVDNPKDVVLEAPGEGTLDRVFASVSYTVTPGAEIEVLSTTLHTGVAPIDLTGNEFTDTIFGNAGTNMLDGKGGVDTLMGLGGDDLYFVDSASDSVIEGAGQGTGDRIFASVSYAMGAGVEVELLSTDSTFGTAPINLAGNELANRIAGNAGANTLDGRGGADLMWGGNGDDFYFVDNSSDQAFENGGEGTDRVFASVSYALASGQQIETLTTGNNAGTAPIDLSGNELANIIYGNAGSNRLDGKEGADTLVGLGGDDFYFVDSAGDVVVERAGEGFGDRVFASVSYTLGAGAQVETLTTDNNGATNPINLTGNELVNTIFGNAGASFLDGKGGADTLVGFGGDDMYFVDNAADAVIERAGEGTGDRIFASVSYAIGAGVQVELLSTDATLGAAAINLTGNELANAVIGNAGSNALKGMDGNDVLFGGAGADAFVFNTSLGAGNLDHVLDFNFVASGGDLIVLHSGIFTALAPGALPASAYRLGSAALDADDHVIYNPATGELSYDADGVGGAAAVNFAVLDNLPNLASSQFLIV